MKLAKNLLLASLPIFLHGCATAPVQVAEEKGAIQITDVDKVKPIAITKVVAKLKRGDHIGEIEGGIFCVDQPGNLTWGSSSQINFTTEELVDIFREELEVAGWPVVGTTENLFTGYNYSGAEVLVAAKVDDIQANLCYPMMGFGDFTNGKGEMFLRAEWQVYSPARKEIVATFYSEGSSVLTQTSNMISDGLLANSFAQSVRNLLANQEFLEAVSRASRITTERAVDRVLQNATTIFNSVQEALDYGRESTVIVRTANGHGSGFPVGKGNLLMTNAHVVGDAQKVTIVTQQGISFEADVIDKSSERDVALISMGTTTMRPLSIAQSKQQTGSEVYAIGAPLKEELTGTITRGIVSGYREYDGHIWLQSDASVNPGNSGGPIVNELGEVVGITTQGFTLGGQTGINLFVPIDDAMKFLGLGLE